MAPTVYSFPASPPCRAVLLTAKALGLELDVKNVDLMNGGTATEEFKQMNPQHSIPLLNDEGFFLAESRAIQQYLSDKFGKNDSLFPKDLKLRATVNARLQFDATLLYVRAGMAYLAPAFRGAKFDPDNIPRVDEALAILESFIGSESLYLVNNQLTLADISILVTVSTLEAVGHNLSSYKNISRWFANLKKVLPGYDEINQKPLDFLSETYKKIMASKGY